MDPDGRLLARDEPVYREFVRLYQLARGLRRTSVDRWNGELLVSPVGHLGGFSPITGRIRLAGDSVLRHLDPASTTTTRYERAEALATVLHEATHAGMETDAPHEPNAVRSRVSTAAMEGLAEVRTIADFEVYAAVAGYPGLVIGRPQYAGAFAAMDHLVNQVTGPALDRQALIADAVRGPGAMHFDQLANAAVQNRLAEVVPPRAEDQLRVRAALIETMAHPLWPTLLGDRPPEAGTMVANEIRQHLNQKIDEIRHHYRSHSTRVFPADVPNPDALQIAESNRSAALSAAEAVDREEPVRGTRLPSAGAGASSQLRFLDGLAPAAGAARRRPSLGQGARPQGGSATPTPQRRAEGRWD
ncbi:hypothetical protein [Kribbella italica]|uniref:Uncharacterized protein n=1 Tax=Kribbella italica TaxID=1540520 RepID=A0A7W9J7E9_9ACTN|nr:hypothetical protein [Kribbella italica]MBB5836487.1 hypothetical protein [Kribbella italica]